MTMLTTGKANLLNNLGFEMYKTVQKRKKENKTIFPFSS